MLTAIDLFAGAGGFSLGATWAGYEVTHSLEIDDWACETLRANHQDTAVLNRNIVELSDSAVKRDFPRYPDLMVGGPPCQGFSHAAVGRQDPKDPRNSLFREFVRVAKLREPRRVIIENVPGLLRAKTAAGDRVGDLIVQELESLGYNVTIYILNAHEFGVPQIRRRVFFAGDLEAPLPAEIYPTHGENDLFGELHPFVTVRDAISDLPLVDVGSKLDPIAYDREAVNEFQRRMRSAGGVVSNHVPMQHTPRMVERFKAIRPGQSQSDVPEEHAPRIRVRKESEGPSRYDQNNRRMHWDRPCHTVPATFYANFVHPELHRNFTPREGARIQSFPDDYVFKGKATVVSQKLLAREGRDGERHLSQYVQIGNAVPPLLAQHLLTTLQQATIAAAAAKS